MRRMSFPFVLDLNSFISEDEAPAATSESPSAAEDGEVKPEAAATAGAANSDPGSAAAAASSTVGPADWGPGSAASTNIGYGLRDETSLTLFVAALERPSGLLVLVVQVT